MLSRQMRASIEARMARAESARAYELRPWVRVLVEDVRRLLAEIPPEADVDLGETLTETPRREEHEVGQRSSV